MAELEDPWLFQLKMELALLVLATDQCYQLYPFALEEV